MPYFAHGTAKHAIGKKIINYDHTLRRKVEDVLRLAGDLETEIIAWTFSLLDLYSWVVT